MLGISAGCEYHVQIYRGVRDFPWKIQTSLIYIVRLLKIGIIPPCMYLEGVMPLMILEDFLLLVLLLVQSHLKLVKRTS